MQNVDFGGKIDYFLLPVGKSDFSKSSNFVNGNSSLNGLNFLKFSEKMRKFETSSKKIGKT